MEVLEARQVAAGDDQVHALGVLDVEVAHRLAAVVDDAEAQLPAAPAAQLGIRDDQAQAMVGDGEAADGHRHLVAAVAHPGRSVAARRGGVDDRSGEGADAEEPGQRGRDAGELGYQVGVFVRHGPPP